MLVAAVALGFAAAFFLGKHFFPGPESTTPHSPFGKPHLCWFSLEKNDSDLTRFLLLYQALIEARDQVQADEGFVLGDDDASGVGHGRRLSAPGTLLPRPGTPTGREGGLKHRTVWVRIPPGAQPA